MHPPASPRENYMTVKIGINGFGRIGRLAFRRIFELQEKGGEAADIEVTAINDLTSPAALAYLLKYDSTHGVFKHVDGTPVDVKSTDTAIVVDGKEYPVYAERDARDLKWVANDGVEFVLECTGFYTSAEKSQAHLDAGAKKVLISAPAKDETTPTVVFGVNHDILKKDDNIVSAGSCTTNSMAAMVKLLNDKWGIKAGFMTTIHAYTGTQMILDGPRGNKFFNDPAATEIYTVLEKDATVDEINAAFKDAFADCAYYGYNDDEIVSGDIVGDTHGGVFDPTQTDVTTVDGVTMARTVAFYDNEYGFTSNMVRTLEYFAEISE